MWMAAGFIGAFALAVVVIAFFGAGTGGIVLALRVTARWSLFLFWLAYAGGALAKLMRTRLPWLSRSGRDLGLSFASAQLVHVALVLWLLITATEPSSKMVYLWLGILCTYLLALFSLPRLRNLLGPRLWMVLRTIALEYIAIVFAFDFIIDPLKARGFAAYPLSYLPFALTLIGGAALRVFAFVRSRPPPGTTPLFLPP